MPPKTKDYPFLLLRPQRGLKYLFFIKINVSFYIKTSSTNYMPLFTELKNIFQFLRYCKFCKKCPIQTYRPQFFQGQFSWKFKESLKIYVLLHFSSNLLKFLEYVFYIITKKNCYLCFLVLLKNKNFIKKLIKKKLFN